MCVSNLWSCNDTAKPSQSTSLTAWIKGHVAEDGSRILHFIWAHWMGEILSKDLVSGMEEGYTTVISLH